MSPWIKIVNRSDFPEGSAKTVTVEEENIAVYHVEGQFYAIAGNVLMPGARWRKDQLKNILSSVPGMGLVSI